MRNTTKHSSSGGVKLLLLVIVAIAIMGSWRHEEAADKQARCAMHRVGDWNCL
jgi:hypothetical protein